METHVGRDDMWRGGGGGGGGKRGKQQKYAKSDNFDFTIIRY